MELVDINIMNVIGTSYCVDSSDGKKIFNKISDAIGRGKHVNLSFSGISLVTTVFLNEAIGKLFKDYSIDQFNEIILPVDLEDKFKKSWNLVCENSPIYYSQQEVHDTNFTKIIEE